MPKWTEEQQLAIDKENTNIIVSAGAGSGKTAVLSERVIRKLEQGVDIDHLLILTFTKAAAFEMMIRIRDKIKERPALKKQLDKIDMAYITTFDAFSLSIVKKYHYLLDVERNIMVINQNIMNIEKIQMLDEIFEEYYKIKKPSFFQLLDHFTLKDDLEIKKFILTIDSHLDLRYDKEQYLENYVKEHFQKEIIDCYIQDFLNLLKQKIGVMQTQLDTLLNEVDEVYGEELKIAFAPLFASTSYKEILRNSCLPRKNLPQNSSQEAKKAKEVLFQTGKSLQELLIYENEEEMEVLFQNSKPILEILVQILQKLNQKVASYKKKRNAYEFTDISKMAIRLVKENPSINQELRNAFDEIMVDEYQDTSDLQEEFIQSISKNNVYMVGDIKQSIYRFRNANPYLFKEKYDRYGKGDGGFKIDLMRNFRSRNEVLENINLIFNCVMDEELGGCKYQEEHQMIFGNRMYEKEKVQQQNMNLEVYNYHFEKELGYSKDEIEAFIIVKDIVSKIQTQYQIVDKKTFHLRNCNYGDFTILIDTAKSFELYHKIFEYFKIPLAVYKETSITKEDDIYIFNNLLKLIYLLYHKQFDEEFRYSFISVCRSYLTDIDDKEIFRIIKNNSYLECDIIKRMQPILACYHEMNGVCLIDQIMDLFDLYERQILVGNIDHFMARISYLKTLFEEMSSLGYSIDESILHFNRMVEEGYDMKVTMTKDDRDAVKIMTIHKSKGLEFPILYMAGLSNKFNIRELNEKFMYDQKFGILIPFYKNQELTNILKPLIKNCYIKEEISEKIRLFYVALTRAKEKMILVSCNDQEDDGLNGIVDFNTKYNYRSFLDILKSIWDKLKPYKREIDMKKIPFSKDYLYTTKDVLGNEDLIATEKICYQEIKIENELIEQQRFSKSDAHLLTQKEYESIELGKRFHAIFENIDFQNPDFSHLTDFEREHVQNFLNLDILGDMHQAKIYKEYEFIVEEKRQKKHGIIDVFIEYPDRIKIIDYKLKQVGDTLYEKQLNGYRDYIQTKTTKPIEIYLYSILDNQFKQI